MFRIGHSQYHTLTTFVEILEIPFPFTCSMDALKLILLQYFSIAPPPPFRRNGGQCRHPRSTTFHDVPKFFNHSRKTKFAHEFKKGKGRKKEGKRKGGRSKEKDPFI